MTRVLSQRLRTAIYAPETGEALIPLIELTRQGWPSVVRRAGNGEDIVHQGATYEWFPFAITMPDDLDEGQPKADFVADNVSTDLIDDFRASTLPIYARVIWVMLSTPDNVEMELEGEIYGVEYDENRITGSITVEPVLDKPLVALSFTPENYPGLFG